MILQKIFDEATEKAGNQAKLGQMLGIPQTRVSEFRNYKGAGRKPSDVMIGQLAEYIGRNPIETILACKLETDKEKATLWQAWLKDWRAYPDSNWGPSASEADTLSN